MSIINEIKFNKKISESVQKDIENNEDMRDVEKKVQWIVDRAKNYGKKMKLNWKDILNAWEEDRSYWYMNYYQDANQPLIEGKVKVFNTVEDMLKVIGKKFRCPCCNEISTNPYTCNSGKELETGKGKKKKTMVCDWKVYGLLGDLGKGLFVYCKDKLRGETIFMPISLEKEFNKNIK